MKKFLSFSGYGVESFDAKQTEKEMKKIKLVVVFTLVAVVLVTSVTPATADIYLHHPNGSGILSWLGLIG